MKFWDSKRLLCALAVGLSVTVIALGVKLDVIVLVLAGNIGLVVNVLEITFHRQAKEP